MGRSSFMPMEKKIFAQEENVKTKKIILSILILLIISANLFACAKGKNQPSYSPKVSYKQAKTASVSIRVQNADLTIQGGAKELMEADFSYPTDKMKPEITYTEENSSGKLLIKQPTGLNSSELNSDNIWDLKLSNDIPINLSLFFASGTGRLYIRKMSLNSLDITMGTGKLTIDLSGQTKKNVDIKLRAALGDVSFYFPTSIGVTATIKGGMGTIVAPSFEQKDNIYTTSNYGKTKNNITVSIISGTGKIDLLTK